MLRSLRAARDELSASRDEPDRLAGEPERRAAEPDRPAPEPDRLAGEPDRPADEPDRPAPEPGLPAVEPDRPSSEPDRPAAELDRPPDARASLPRPRVLGLDALRPRLLAVLRLFELVGLSATPEGPPALAEPALLEPALLELALPEPELPEPELPEPELPDSALFERPLLSVAALSSSQSAPALRATCPRHPSNAGRTAPAYARASQNAEGHHLAVTALSGKMSGDVLLSHAVPRAVPSALKGLTSGFGMGPGVSPSLWPPKLYGDVVVPDRTSGTAQWTRNISESRSQATRPISTGQLHTLPCFHLRPINPVV